MVTPLQHKMTLRWANNQPWIGGHKVTMDQLFKVGDSLKGTKKGKKLAILTPSYLLRKIDYAKLINSPNIDTMTVNHGIYLDESEKCDFYLPFTTKGKTMAKNKEPEYIEWMKKFKGIAMHGIYIPDNPSPYYLATVPELQYLIKTCPNAKITAWRHVWGSHLKSGHMGTRMCEFPNYAQWTPSKIPWGHCGAISGFAIPLAMALGYSEINVVGMGYEFVSNDYKTGHLKPLISQKTIKRGSWFGIAPTRFKNQAALAKKYGVKLRVGPKKLIEPALLKFFGTFDKVDDLI